MLGMYTSFANDSGWRTSDACAEVSEFRGGSARVVDRPRRPADPEKASRLARTLGASLPARPPARRVQVPLDRGGERVAENVEEARPRDRFIGHRWAVHSASRNAWPKRVTFVGP